MVPHALHIDCLRAGVSFSSNASTIILSTSMFIPDLSDTDRSRSFNGKYRTFSCILTYYRDMTGKCQVETSMACVIQIDVFYMIEGELWNYPVSAGGENVY